MFLITGLAVGSWLSLSKSLGKDSAIALCSWSLTSFLYPARELYFCAALTKLPSGLRLILIGLKQRPALLV